VSYQRVPSEAIETLALIAAEGPYPYRQDGSTFQNREGILPDRPQGFYREFTVETPGSPDRGARRLVVGEDMAVFYTEDHYDSFRFLVP
jgi:ribonuclease T1